MKKIYLLIISPLLLLSLVTYADTVDLDKKISLQVDEAPINTVLQMIARQHNYNIVQSAEVGGDITLNLNEVALGNALDAILTANGYNFYVSGNIIIVKPFEALGYGEMVSQVIELDYITPETAIKALENNLSAKGKLSAIDKPDAGIVDIEIIATRIVITDLPEFVEMALKTIALLDVRQPQVSIEVRMIETNFDNETTTGFKWPTSLTARAHGVQMSSSTGSSSGGSSVEAIGQVDLPKGKWQWGKLSVQELQTVLDFLELEGNSKLISDPKITTMNNHPAEIEVTTVIPIQTINRFSEGGSVQDIVTFQDEEVGITLYVTPHITRNNEIILDVNPTVAEIIGYSGPADNQKPITSERSIKTKVTVKDGESVVLGGLLKENKIEDRQKLFLLGSIPFIGGLFTHKSTQSSTTDLTILITPKILND